MNYCLGVDVDAIDSMYCLVSENGELIFPTTKYEHTNSEFKKVIEHIGTIDQTCVSVILESTFTYHLKVVRLFHKAQNVMYLYLIISSTNNI